MIYLINILHRRVFRSLLHRSDRQVCPSSDRFAEQIAHLPPKGKANQSLMPAVEKVTEITVPGATIVPSGTLWDTDTLSVEDTVPVTLAFSP